MHVGVTFYCHERNRQVRRLFGPILLNPALPGHRLAVASGRRSLNVAAPMHRPEIYRLTALAAAKKRRGQSHVYICAKDASCAG